MYARYPDDLNTAQNLMRENMESEDSSSSSRCSSRPISSSSSDSDDTNRPFACPFPGCSQRFKRSYTLKDHVNSHTGDRPHICPVPSCGRSFATSGNLARHKRKHPWLGLPLECLVDGCHCSFSSEVKLERHMRSHFGEAEDRRCSVPNCGKVFSTPGNLRRHIRINHSAPCASVVPSPSVSWKASAPLFAYPRDPAHVSRGTCSGSEVNVHPEAGDVRVKGKSTNDSLREVIGWLLEGEGMSSEWDMGREIRL